MVRKDVQIGRVNTVMVVTSYPTENKGMGFHVGVDFPVNLHVGLVYKYFSDTYIGKSTGLMRCRIRCMYSLHMCNKFHYFPTLTVLI